MTVDRIALIGYRATGKTSVGRLLAARRGWQFCDTDAEVERSAGKTIAVIFAEDGEEAFRDWETEAVRHHAQRRHCVLSLGGGAVMRPPNRQSIADVFTVWLTASPESVHQRFVHDAATAAQRPNLTSQGGLAEIRALLAARSPTYAACADLIVDTEGKSVPQVVDEINKALDELTHFPISRSDSDQGQ